MAQKAVREEDYISQDDPQPSLRRNNRAKALALETESGRMGQSCVHWCQPSGREGLRASRGDEFWQQEPYLDQVSEECFCVAYFVTPRSQFLVET